MPTYHRAWGCHACGKLSSDVLFTKCGCPYHETCLPEYCILHGRETTNAIRMETRQEELKGRRELLRDIQAAGFRGVRVETILVSYEFKDLERLFDKGLILFSPHDTTVFDAKSHCQIKTS